MKYSSNIHTRLQTIIYTDSAARYYNSDLSIWISVDPLSDKYPNLSPYTYCADNPVRFFDPDGRDFGNYYDWGGIRIGTDKIDDNKTYIVKNGAGISVNDGVVRVNDNNSVVLLPDINCREEIVNKLVEFDSQNPNAEWGGFCGSAWNQATQSYERQSVRWGEYGEQGDPCVPNSLISFDCNTINADNFQTSFDYHSHGSGICEATGKGWIQMPSEVDMSNSAQRSLSSQGRIFASFGMKDKMVYFYDNNSCYGKLSFDNFLKIK